MNHTHDELLDETEGRELRSITDRLDRERPMPSPDFRVRLQMLLADAATGNRNHFLMGRLAVACGGSGIALLAALAAGVAGLGPLAAG